MLARTPLYDLMVAWLQQQDPKITYNWDNGCDCACARFADATGRHEEWAEYMRGVGQYGNWVQVMLHSPTSRDLSEWDMLNSAANCGSRDRNGSHATYGQLLERLS
jgi:hypothetical protein